MIRDLDQLTERTFDVLVVGGGIYGLAIAYDAAQRGLSAAVIEQGDFGSGASFNHLRTVHGGLRYLQTLDLGRARESIRERRALARIAPHTVRPVPFVIPIYLSPLRGKIAMRAGLLLDRLIGFDRNRRVSPVHKLPAGRVVSKGRAVQDFPGLKRRGLRGAAVFYDYVTTESDRLTFSFGLAAAAHGAVLANHVEGTELLKEGRRVTGVRARDAMDGRRLEIAAQVTVNATGAAIDRLLDAHGVSLGIPMVRAMNLVTRRDSGEEALAGVGASGRHLFLVPWRQRALFGTWESREPGKPREPREPREPGEPGKQRHAEGQTSSGGCISASDVTSFIDDLNQAFPALDLSMSDITLVHRGVVPVREAIRDHASQGLEGLLSVAGAKFTTARAVAERVTDILVSKLPHAPATPCRTGELPLPGGSIRDVGLLIGAARREHDVGLPTDTIPHLVNAYGRNFEEVLNLATNRPDWKQRLAPDSPVIGAELVWAVRKEMAMTLADAMIRRTPLGALGYPGDEATNRAALIVAGELGWSDERRLSETTAVRDFYGVVNALNT
jgi:glycerol-3-phosphate dehydrogenase